MKNERILVVDDDRDIVATLKIQLEKEGFEVFCAYDGQEALDFLGSFRRKLRVNRLDLKLTMAGDDPCDLAINYGRAWAAVGNLMPQLERLFVIKDRNIEVACDFTASQTLVEFRSEVTITLGRLLSLAVVYGIRVFREFWKIKTKRKGGAAV